MLAKHHVHHGFHVHGGLLGFVVVIVASTVFAMLVVVVVASRFALWAIGGLVTLLLASWAIVGRFEVALGSNVPLLSTHLA